MDTQNSSNSDGNDRDLAQTTSAATAEPDATPRDPGRRSCTKWEYGCYTPIVKPLRWIRWSALGQRLPAWILNPIVYVIQHIYARIQHAEYQRKDSTDSAWVTMNEFAVPSGEHVAIPAVFVVELFPPSEFKQLKQSIKRNQWYAAQLGLTPVDPTMLEKARSGSGWDWWLLGAVAGRNRRPRVGDARLKKMPEEFDAVTLRAVQIGHGITAVVAHFYMSDKAAKYVDSVWHKTYGPEFVWGLRGEWSRAETADSAASRHTQRARQSIHDAARNWLGRTAPGFFAANDEPQPLVDILLFNTREATIEQNPTGQQDGAYRALGLTHHTIVQTSEQLPAMNLERADRPLGQYVDGRRTWALWGQRQAIVESARNLDMYGSYTDDAIAAYVSDGIENYLLRLSVSELLAVYISKYAAVRDSARSRHGQFRMKRLKELRSDLLTLSLNVSSVQQDIRAFNRTNGPFLRDPIFTRQSAPWIKKLDAKLGRRSIEPIDTNKQMSESQTEMLTDLSAIDSQYRDILTAAASLTSSMQALRAAVVARWIALSSLAVSALVFLLSDTAKHTRLSSILNWISTHAHHLLH